MTPAQMQHILTRLASVSAPSQTVAYTRATIIRELVGEILGTSISTDYQGTGNAAILLGDSVRFAFFAHADEASYLVNAQLSKDAWELLPFCSHRAQANVEARVLRYNNLYDRLDIVAEGIIETSSQHSLPWLRVVSGEVVTGDRIVMYYPLTVSETSISGVLDNLVGVAACLAAINGLIRIGIKLPVGFFFTDEEAGPPDSNATFARGTRRLLHRIESPHLCVVVDAHEIEAGQLGKGALFAEKSSLARGAVVPPHIFQLFRQFASSFLSANKIHVSENHGYVSRSDCVACFEFSPNVLLLGYPMKDSLFDKNAPQAMMTDIIALAKAIAWTALCSLADDD